jgi:hypothetical protein
MCSKDLLHTSQTATILLRSAKPLHFIEQYLNVSNLCGGTLIKDPQFKQARFSDFAIGVSDLGLKKCL